MAMHAIKGSERTAVTGARSLGPAAPDERLEVSVLVRRRQAAALAQRANALQKGERFEHLTREEFGRQYGADPADLAALRKYASSMGLVVVEENAVRRTVVLSGVVSQFNKAFSVDLQRFEHPGGTYRGRVGTISLPDELVTIVEGVYGLDNRRIANPHFRIRRNPGNVRWETAAQTQAVSYSPPQVATLYGFPTAGAAGQTIAIIELGGGYRSTDLSTYFKGLKLGAPNVTAVAVDHGANHPTGDGNGPDGEVMLDIEVAASVAPSAAIVVYFTPNTDAGFIDAVSSAIHDTTHKPSVVSISWGGPESSWSASAMTSFNQVLQEAATLGVTVCVASGDNGSSDGVTDGANHVDFPASSPFVLACGGTNLQGNASTITSETVWNDGASGGAGGGGVSTFFALPTWQSGLTVTTTAGATQPLAMRGVPDVCGDADPESGYNVRVDGQDTVIGGTSAVAPLWAGLIANLNATLTKPIGFANPLLYSHASDLNDVTQGNNGSFAASAGWDACTGLGSPNGAKLAALFAASGTT
jgi:kumamolisin